MIYRSINLKWLGHSGFKIKTGSGRELVIYIDPYNISEDNERADILFITHSHYDHCSIEDIRKIARDNTLIICPADVSSKMRHIPGKVDIRVAEIGGKMEFFDGIVRFWTVPAYNLGKNAHSKEEDWVGYLLQIDGVLIYHAGDTDFIPEMKSMSNSNIDIALLPIGGGNFTMNAGEAAKAAAAIKPKLAIPMHYASISGVGDKSDGELFLKFCSKEGIEAKILEKSEY